MDHQRNGKSNIEIEKRTQSKDVLFHEFRFFYRCEDNQKGYCRYDSQYNKSYQVISIEEIIQKAKKRDGDHRHDARGGDIADTIN